MTEQQIQKKILNYLFDCGHYAVKVITASRSGVPDIIACVNGHFIAIEVKKPGGVVSKLQEHNGRKVTEAGGSFAVVYSCEEAKEFINNAANATSDK